MRVLQVGLASILVVSLAAALPGLYHYTESGPQSEEPANASSGGGEPALDRLDLKTVNEVSKPAPPDPSELPETPFKLDELTAAEELQAERVLRVDINNAKPSQLQRIPGIGPSTAKDIIEYRNNQTISSVSDLDRIDGIGPATVDKMKEHVLIQGNIPD